MKTPLTSREYQRLELVNPAKAWRQVAIARLQDLAQQLAQAWQGCLSSSSQLQVWQRRDRRGQVWWYARDLTTGHVLHHATETEMRRWLEQRYSL